MTYLFAHLRQIGELTLQHVELVVAGLVLGLLIAVPAGVLAARSARAQTAIFGGASVLYTIPSLALLALAVRYLGLGALPVVLLLAAYAQFMLVRAVAGGLRGVPPAHLEAARGLGMTSAQSFCRIQLPLALPVIAGGTRLATVALIAIATLGGYVGAGGLGNEIFFGLQRAYVQQTLAGSIPVAILALIADALFRALETRLRRRAGF